MATILALTSLIGDPANSVKFDAFLRAVAATYAADVQSGAASVSGYVLLSYYIGKYVCAAPYRDYSNRAAGAGVGRRKGGCVCRTMRDWLRRMREHEYVRQLTFQIEANYLFHFNTAFDPPVRR